MPTYEYRCPQGHEFEQFFLKISDAKAALPCPECSELAERRISGGAGLLFKGSGFYITDYGKDGKKDRKPAAKPDAKSDAKTDAGGGGDGAKGGEGKPNDTKSGDAKPAASASPPAAAPVKPPSSPSGGGE